MLLFLILLNPTMEKIKMHYIFTWGSNIFI
jgi:hypothetical protein